MDEEEEIPSIEEVEDLPTTDAKTQVISYFYLLYKSFLKLNKDSLPQEVDESPTEDVKTPAPFELAEDYSALYKSFNVFSFRPTQQEVEQSYDGFDEMVKQYDNLENLTYEEVSKLQDDFTNYRNYYCRRMGLYDFFGPGPYGQDLQRISDRKRELSILNDKKSALYYSDESKVIMTEDEEVNGYKLFNASTNIMDYETFQMLMGLKDIAVPDNEFMEWLEDNCCSDWGKQDRHGECFGGFWKYPEGSPERENAYTLSTEDNFKGLCELPYPREIIKKTVQYGCSNRHESVRYSNFLCEWVTRKAKFLSNNVISLKMHCVATMKHNDIAPKDLPEEVVDLFK